MFEKERVNRLSKKELHVEALNLKREDRFMLVEDLIKSLDEQDKKLDNIWGAEAEKRLRA